jgi:hypothetical protein
MSVPLRAAASVFIVAYQSETTCPPKLIYSSEKRVGMALGETDETTYLAFEELIDVFVVLAAERVVDLYCQEIRKGTGTGKRKGERKVEGKGERKGKESAGAKNSVRVSTDRETRERANAPCCTNT